MKYVYLIQIEGKDIYKIGHSKNPKTRIKNVQTGNPFKVLVASSYKSKRAIKIETCLHHRFSSHKITEDDVKLQGEWFKLDSNLVKDFQKICEQIDNNFKVLEENSTLYDKKSKI